MTAPPAVRRLVDEVLDAPPPGDSLHGELLAWLTVSARVRAFTEAHRDKIRKKARGARGDAARRDLRAELRVAALLLADRRLDLAFEAYGAGRGGPDFTATFRAGPPFNVEVTRRQMDASDAAATPAAALVAPVLAKLRQLPPSRPNVLVVAVDGVPAAPDPGPVLRELRLRADRDDDEVFRTRGLGRAAFIAGMLRLAAVVAWAEDGRGGERVIAWANPGAHIALPEPTLRAVADALAADGGPEGVRRGARRSR